MFIQTQETPNPNSLKFLPGKRVSNDGPYEFLNANQTQIPLLKNILSINGVTGIFLSEDFLSINKSQDEKWENIKHIVISHLNEFYDKGNEFIINKKSELDDNNDYGEIENISIKTKLDSNVLKKIRLLLSYFFFEVTFFISILISYN